MDKAMKTDKPTLESVLRLYVDTDEPRAELRQPFYQGDNLFATNAHVLIRMPRSWMGDRFSEQTKPDVLGFDWTTNNDTVLTASDLEAFLTSPSVPEIDEMREVGEDVECEECDGYGVVEWTYKGYTREFEYPKCDGDGYSERAHKKPTGRIIRDPTARIEIDGVYFRHEYLSVLLRRCVCLKSTSAFGRGGFITHTTFSSWMRSKCF